MRNPVWNFLYDITDFNMEFCQWECPRGTPMCIWKPILMMTSSNVNIFRVTGPLCGEFTGHRWIHLTKASNADHWCFLWSTPKKGLSKQSRCWWFEMPPRSLWRHCNVSNAWFQIRDVIKKSTHADPALRPSAGEVLGLLNRCSLNGKLV